MSQVHFGSDGKVEQQNIWELVWKGPATRKKTVILQIINGFWARPTHRQKKMNICFPSPSQVGRETNMWAACNFIEDTYINNILINGGGLDKCSHCNRQKQDWAI